MCDCLTEMIFRDRRNMQNIWYVTVIPSGRSMSSWVNLSSRIEVWGKVYRSKPSHSNVPDGWHQFWDQMFSWRAESEVKVSWFIGWGLDPFGLSAATPSANISYHLWHGVLENFNDAFHVSCSDSLGIVFWRWRYFWWRHKSFARTGGSSTIFFRGTPTSLDQRPCSCLCR